jgi:hypothetical protein
MIFETGDSTIPLAPHLLQVGHQLSHGVLVDDRVDRALELAARLGRR